MTTKTAPAKRIPIPENFPIDWENPQDAKLLWRLDSRITTPQSPLSFSMIKVVIMGGFNAAFPDLGLPINFRVIHVNGYPYTTAKPTEKPPATPPKSTAAANQAVPDLVRMFADKNATGISAQQLEKLIPVLVRLDAYWHDDLLPEINQHLAYFDSTDLRGLSQAQLKAHFTEGLKRVRIVGELHARAGFPAMTAMSMYEDFFQELFPEKAPLDALRLLQGFDNQTLMGDHQLWQLSQMALGIPSVRETLNSSPASRAIPLLTKSADSREFLANFRAYLEKYGQRLSAFGQISEPSWIEDPTPAIEHIKAYLAQPDNERNAHQATLEADREMAISEARADLKGYPQPVVKRFEILLKAAQSGVTIKEDNHWVIERLLYHVRCLALEYGKRLTELGKLDDGQDVFFLKASELMEFGDESKISKEKIQQRKDERERFRHIPPPPMIGMMPQFEPGQNGPLSKAVKKSDGAMQAASVGDGKRLKGLAGSGGRVQAPARIIRSLSEAGKLKPGEVLVAPATLPPWTPLFGIAAAIVTDSGGVLSHCAIVAREYRIPAVVGTGSATKTFRDGELLDVDGDRGVVRIIFSEEPVKRTEL